MRIQLNKYSHIFLIILVICFLGCSNKKVENFQKEKEVVVYSPHGKAILQFLAKEFEKKYPLIKVKWVPISSQECLSRIRAEKENPQADVWYGAPSTLFMQAKEEGLLEKYKPSWSNYVDKEMKDIDDFWYGTFLTPQIIFYNKNTVSEKDAPKDWDDLIDKKWENRIVIPHPLQSGTIRTIFIAMIWKFYDIDQKPDRGYDFLLKLDANTKEYVANLTMMLQKVMKGGADVGIWNLPFIKYVQIKKNYPLEISIPKSGTPIICDSIAIIKGCKNDFAAKLYYEFINSIDISETLAKEHFKIIVRSDMPKEKLPTWQKELNIKKMPIDWNKASSLSKNWMIYWDHNIKGQGRVLLGR